MNKAEELKKITRTIIDETIDIPNGTVIGENETAEELKKKYPAK